MIYTNNISCEADDGIKGKDSWQHPCNADEQYTALNYSIFNGFAIDLPQVVRIFSFGLKLITFVTFDCIFMFIME